MPPKKPTAAAKGKAANAAPATKARKTAPKKAVPTTASTQSASAEPAGVYTNKKRKAQDDGNDTRVNGIKRARSKSMSATPVTAPKRKAAAATKKPKQKVVIKSPPTQRLNVYVFGEGSSGELGLGPEKGQLEVKRPRLNPLLDAEKVGVVHLSVGGMHTAALTHDNKILTWGVNDQGALGRDTAWEGGLRDIDDDNSDSDSESDSETGVNPRESTPAEVDVSGLPGDVVWTQLACTDSATFALTDEGQVYGWGTFRASNSIL